MADMVNHPPHYTFGGIETIDYLEGILGTGFPAYCVGNAVKYLSRWQHKGGVEDLKKAQWYINRVIDHHNANYTSFPGNSASHGNIARAKPSDKENAQKEEVSTRIWEQICEQQRMWPQMVSGRADAA